MSVIITVGKLKKVINDLDNDTEICINNNNDIFKCPYKYRWGSAERHEECERCTFWELCINAK